MNHDAGIPIVNKKWYKSSIVHIFVCTTPRAIAFFKPVIVGIEYSGNGWL